MDLFDNICGDAEDGESYDFGILGDYIYRDTELDYFKSRSCRGVFFHKSCDYVALKEDVARLNLKLCENESTLKRLEGSDTQPYIAVLEAEIAKKDKHVEELNKALRNLITESREQQEHLAKLKEAMP